MQDVVIVGAGIAGLSAAVRSAELGSRVSVLEKGADPSYACNTRWSGGGYHLCMHEVSETPERLQEILTEITDNTVDERVAAALAHDFRRAIDWLRQQGVRFIRVPGNLHDTVVAPPRPARTGVTWEMGRGGDALLRVLTSRLEALGGRLLLQHRATRLIVEDGACVGVVAETAGTVREFRATAVILADGGYQANIDLLGQHVAQHPDKILQRNAGSGTGDGLSMALAVGARSAGLEYGFYGHLVAREAWENAAIWPYPQIDHVAAVSVVVGPNGKRFTDEGQGGVHIANIVAQQEDPLGSIVVFDDAVWNDRGRYKGIPVNPWLEQAGGKVWLADTIEAIAEQLGIDPAALRETVDAFNQAIASKTLDQLAPVRTTAKAPAFPILRAPFRAIRLTAGITYTLGGIAIDADGQVQKADDAPFPGLFAAGSTTGGLEGGPRFGYVGGLSKATIFGMRAAEHIATLGGARGDQGPLARASA
jgi:fumarate reductase flavoprotein subunit